MEMCVKMWFTIYYHPVVNENQIRNNPWSPGIIIQILLTGLHTFHWENLLRHQRQFIFGDHFPNSHDLYVLLCTDMVRRNLMLITIGAQRVNSVKLIVRKPKIVNMCWIALEITLNHQVCFLHVEKTRKVINFFDWIITILFKNVSAKGLHLAFKKTPSCKEFIHIISLYTEATEKDFFTSFYLLTLKVYRNWPCCCRKVVLTPWNNFHCKNRRK